MKDWKQCLKRPPVLPSPDPEREAAILAMERDIASGKVLVDGERIHMMTAEEARAVFGDTDNHLIISLVPPRRGGRRP